MNIWRMLDLRSALGRPQEGRLTALYMSERHMFQETYLAFIELTQNNAVKSFICELPKSF